MLVLLLVAPALPGQIDFLLPDTAGKGFTDKVRALSSLRDVAQSYSFTAPSGRRITVLRVSDDGVGEVAERLDELGLDYVIDYPPRRLHYVPNDPLVGARVPLSSLNYSIPYHLTLIGAFLTWDHWPGAQGVITAVLDTGFDTSHPDLASNLWTNQAEKLGLPGVDDDGNGYVDDLHGYDFVHRTAALRKLDPITGISHGTAVAGLIGARGDNDQGIAALAGGVKGRVGTQLMLLAVVDDEGKIPLAAELEAIAYAISQGAKVINMSFGGRTTTPLEAEELSAASKEALLVASAGNYNPGLENPWPVDYPARYPSVVAVGATELRSRLPGRFYEDLAVYSRYQPGERVIELTAPGTGMITTAWDGKYHRPGFDPPLAALKGTSFAAPLVSAAAAMLFANLPSDSPAEVRAALHRLVDDLGEPGPDPRFGYGRLNLARMFRPAGDADGDGEVTDRDLELVASLFGARQGSPRYDPQADLNEDRVIDELDWLMVAANYRPPPEDNGSGEGEGSPGG